MFAHDDSVLFLLTDNNHALIGVSHDKCPPNHTKILIFSLLIIRLLQKHYNYRQDNLLRPSYMVIVSKFRQLYSNEEKG